MNAQISPTPASQQWFVYILRCADRSLYIGMTRDVARRLREHQDQGTRCAKYLRGRAPLSLEFSVAVNSRSEALRLEYRLKKMSRQQKENLIAGNQLLAAADRRSG
jgi:putative endonuclease